MKSNDQTLNRLGLALRAGRIIDGEGRVLQAMSKHPKAIVFLAQDAGDNIKKKIYDKTTYYQLTLNEDYSSDELSKALGKLNRKVVMLIDPRFID